MATDVDDGAAARLAAAAPRSTLCAKGTKGAKSAKGAKRKGCGLVAYARDMERSGDEDVRPCANLRTSVSHQTPHTTPPAAAECGC